MSRIAIAFVAATLGCSLDRSGVQDLRYDAQLDTQVGTDSSVAFDSELFETEAIDSAVMDASVDATMDSALDAAPDALPDVSSDSKADAGTDTPIDATPETPTCLPATGGSFCSAIPAFKGTQTVDGDPADFCGIAGETWDNSAAAYSSKTVPDAGKVRVHMKVGSSADALHIFVEVEDPKIILDTAATTLWRGDSVELYVAGFGMRTGHYDTSVDVGAKQVVIAPPSGGTAAQSQIFLSGNANGPLDNAQWTAIATPKGYAVELQLPWSELGLDASKAVGGLDVAVNSKWEAGTDHIFSVWNVKTSPSPSSCGSYAVSPSCDDRTWCSPTLAL